MNNYQKNIFNNMKYDLESYCNTDNQCLCERIQHLVDCVEKLNIIGKYDLLETDVDVRKASENSIAVYFRLRRNTKLVIIVDETKYTILNKKDMGEDWQSKYVDNITELEYSIQEFL